MNRQIVRTSLAALAILTVGTAVVTAQAVTVAGYVSSGRVPLAGAHVRVDELNPKIDRVTDADGRYSFVVPSSNVRGQAVRITASMQDRRVRYLPKTVAIQLTGVPITQNFDLERVAEGQPIAGPVDSPPGSGVSRVNRAVRGDSVDLSELAGAVDLQSALVGRIAGLDVAPASTLGGSASLTMRGPRSILASNQPLFVLDGVVLDNTVFTSSAQRFGAGGFDYGSSLGDVDLGSIESIRVLRGAEASALYGSRGANGVISVTTKNGSDGSAIAVSANYQHTEGSVVRLPSFQNQYGQGLNGKFEFFNGRGGGINDAIAENWGPRLDGRPLSQSSYTEAGRPDVRLWTARPNNVSNYFATGATSNVTGAVQGRTDLGSFRAFAARRVADGITPRDRLSRLSGGANVTVRPVQRFELSASAFASQTKNENAPGTGYNEGNPVSQFTRMGRQVDTDSLRKHLHDATGKQISWIYTDHNNPYVASLADSNYSRRYHVGGGGAATYAFSSWLTGTARGSIDDYRDGRLFTIASGWMGGFPSYTGQGDFSKGGSEGDEISARQSNLSARLASTRNVGGGTVWTFGVGADQQSRRDRIRSLGVDSALHVPAAGAPTTARLPAAETWIGNSTTTSILGETGVTLGNGANVSAVARNAWSSLLDGRQVTTLYPAVNASADLVRIVPGFRNGTIGEATVRAELWRDASDLTPYSIETMYAGRSLTGSVAPVGNGLLVADPNLAPEITSGLQIGADVSLRAHRIGLGLTYYSERTSGVILPVAGAPVGTLLATNAGEVSNRGAELRLTSLVGDGELGLEWGVSAHASRNWNQVDALYGSTKSLPLGPTQWGMSVEAREGLPLGVLMGRRLLRDGATQALILRNGLPLPDSVAGQQQLGVAQPTWTFGIQNTLRYRWVSVSAIADGHIGGSIFSATNLWGSYAGTLAETAIRPDTGLLIAGIDAATGRANTQHVSTQDYYHALGRVQEPWVYSATFFKLREARLTVDIPTAFGRLPFQHVSASLIGRNLYASIKAPNIDPESVFNPYQLRGVEMGQLPTTKSVGFQLSIIP